jgi:type II secretory pathway pseudopilin PulG
MQGSTQVFGKQQGVSLTGLIFVMAIIGVVAVFAMRVFPTFLEYRAIQGGIAAAKAAGGTERELRAAFNKNAGINQVDAISGQDLVISKDTGETEISFEYEKRIPLFANVRLLFDFAGTTDKSGAAARKPARE